MQFNETATCALGSGIVQSQRMDERTRNSFPKWPRSRVQRGVSPRVQRTLCASYSENQAQCRRERETDRKRGTARWVRVVRARSRSCALLLVGADDEANDGTAYPKLFEESGSGAEIVVLPGVNHFGVFRNEQALERMSDWLKSVR